MSALARRIAGSPGSHSRSPSLLAVRSRCDPVPLALALRSRSDRAPIALRVAGFYTSSSLEKKEPARAAVAISSMRSLVAHTPPVARVGPPPALSIHCQEGGGT